jgi:hypothetical protein
MSFREPQLFSYHSEHLYFDHGSQYEYEYTDADTKGSLHVSRVLN